MPSMLSPPCLARHVVKPMNTIKRATPDSAANTLGCVSLMCINMTIITTPTNPANAKPAANFAHCAAVLTTFEKRLSSFLYIIL